MSLSNLNVCSVVMRLIVLTITYLVELWSILHEAFGGDFPPCMFARINYAIAPSNKMLIVISAAFEIYHALKIGLRSIVEQCLVSGRFAPVVGVARKLARTSAIANGFRNFDN